MEKLTVRLRWLAVSDMPKNKIGIEAAERIEKLEAAIRDICGAFTVKGLRVAVAPQAIKLTDCIIAAQALLNEEKG